MQNLRTLRDHLELNEPTIGTWLQIPSTDVAELMARAGYDWVAVDMEHGSFGRTILPDIFRAIECGGALPFARLAEASKYQIKAALEAGAQGLIFPMIESFEQLDQAIGWATYPGLATWEPRPAEYRGVGYCRANVFGKHFNEYREDSRDLFICAQIEHVRAVEHLADIVSHPRLDAIMVGPYDLSGSMGLTGQFDHPDFRACMEAITTICSQSKALMGLHVVQPNPEHLRQAVNEGARFIAYGIDTVFLWQSAERPQGV